MTKRTCEHCGSDVWKAERFDTVQRTLFSVQRRYETAVSEATRQRIRADLVEVEKQEHISALQSKIRRQGKAIRKLEEKLREAREVGPYHEEAVADPEDAFSHSEDA